MARDRNKRARQRRPRPVREPASTPAQGRPADRRSANPELPDLPAPLRHTGEVDEFDAALVRGAGGVPLDPVDSQSDGSSDGNPDGNGAGSGTVVEPPARSRRRRRGSDEGADQALGEDVAAEEAPVTRPGQPFHQRAIAFLRASWAELQRVQWPDRQHVTQATAVVLGFLVVAGVYLGAADWVAQKIVNLIL